MNIENYWNKKKMYIVFLITVMKRKFEQWKWYGYYIYKYLNSDGQYQQNEQSPLTCGMWKV